MRFKPDVPITSDADDKLGFLDFVNLIRDAIIGTETPFVYGVLGDWGTGKTSILRILQKRFRPRTEIQDDYIKVEAIWFNPWEHENEPNLIYPMIQAIVEHLKQHYTLPLENIERHIKQIARATLFLGNMIAKKNSGFDLFELAEQAKKLKTVDADDILDGWSDQGGKLRSGLEALLAEYAKAIATTHGIKPENIRFVILIDDLDRCLPDTTIAILESIKNYLTVPNVIFVLGLNAQIVYLGIRHKYGNLEIDGRQYLEKILNYSFFVPEPDYGLVEDFTREWFRDLVSIESYKMYKEDLVVFGKVLREARFTNPRKIKRIVNRYLLFIAKYDGDPERQKRAPQGGFGYDKLPLREWYQPMSNIVKLLLIAENFPELFQLYLVEDDSRLRGVVNAIQRLARNELADFESIYGDKYRHFYPQLMRMNTLFDLAIPADRSKPSLRQHIQAVFSLSRIV